MVLRNCWYVVAWNYEVPQEKLVALEDRCARRFAPLSHGRLEGDEVRCLYQGLRIGPHGRCNNIPGLDQPIPNRACVRLGQYPAAVGAGCTSDVSVAMVVHHHEYL